MSEMSISRRSFMAGAAAVAGGLALGGASLGPVSVARADGGTITAACAYTSTNYSPIGCSSALMLGATWHVFEGLYDLDVHNYETYRALAADEPVMVTDTQYEIALRDGAKFSDGVDITAADVVNAFEINMADGTYGAFLSFIDTVTAKDDKTVVFNLKYPFGALLKERLSVVKIFPASLTPEDLAKTPIGSGPWMYTLLDGDDGGCIEFEPNPYYNGQYPATADFMHWDVLLDGTARTTALQGMTSLVMENVPDANVELLEASGCKVEYAKGFGLPFLMFNTRKPPFDDYRVRQAFFYAINVEKLIANVMSGHARPIKSFLPEHYKNFHEASTVFTYDPEKAKQLLADAGKSSIDVTLLTNNNWVRDLAPQIKNDLDAVGINCSIDEQKINWSSLAPTDDVLPYDVMLTPGDPTCFGADPDLLMTWWFGDNVWTRGRSCWADTPEWAELQDLLQAAREATGDEQQEIWNKCFDLLAEQCPLYPLFHRDLATGYWEDALEGFAPIATTGLVFIGASVK